MRQFSIIMRMANIQNRDDSKGCPGCGETGTLSLLLGMQVSTVTLEKALAISLQVKMSHLKDPPTILLSIYLKGLKTT